MPARQDLPAARACYEKRQDWLMLAVMQLNGEGGPPDLKGARASTDRLPRDADTDALKDILKQREAHPDGPRIDFCNEIARTTRSGDACLSLSDRKEAAAAREAVARARDTLAGPKQALLDQVAAAQIRLVAADGKRLYQQYVEGSIRNQAALQQQLIVRRHFVAHLDQWVVRGEVPAAARSTDADGALDAAHRRGEAEFMEAYTPRPNDPADVARTNRTYVADYQRASREAKRAFYAYREAWARLAGKGVWSALTTERAAEVKGDPFDGKPE
jgi:hypothetical protein